MSHLFGVGLQIEIQRIQVQFRMILAKKGGVHNLATCFEQMDANGNGLIEFEEFEKGLKQLGLFPTKVQLQTLFKYYDSDASGCISYNEFIAALRDPLAGPRLEVVQRAWRALDKFETGKVSLDHLFAQFTVSNEPMFIAGKASKEDLFHMYGFENKAKEGCVSKQCFFDLYTDISMGTEVTATFVKMVEHCWQICSE
jgi:Ca2+-binding EF-hand superfamily protein